MVIKKCDNKIAAAKHLIFELQQFKLPFRIRIEKIHQKGKPRQFSATLINLVKEKLKRGFFEKKTL